MRNLMIHFSSIVRFILSTGPQGTKKNIKDSGHGGQTKDQDGDEADGYDEVIYPVDFNDNGHIVDDVCAAFSTIFTYSNNLL